MTPENAQKNISWGNILSTKAIEDIRIINNNINGISHDKEGRDLQDIYNRSADLDTDIIYFQKINLNIKNYLLKNVINKTINSFWKKNITVYSISDIKINLIYKPGNIIIITTETLNNRVISTTNDNLDR